ncbi:hypothetical protein IIY59_01780 [Candidatus Saccharibacteria bacterium]|nr:hypothetical protein [Candidatus Saccharibacteria bacterium]
MKLTNEQAAKYEQAWLNHLKLERELAREDIMGEKQEIEEKAEVSLVVAIVALLGTSILSGFLFKLLMNLGAAKVVLILLAIVGIGTLIYGVKLLFNYGFERKEEVVEGEPIDEEELD